MNKNGQQAFFEQVKKMIEGGEYEEIEVGPEHNFRPGTKLAIVKKNYVFAGAGIGDFICYMPSMVWAAKNCPWIHGRIWVGNHLMQLFENVMHKFPHWKICDIEKINEGLEPRTLLRGPGVPVNGRANHPLLNGTGGHLVTVGFGNMVNYLPPAHLNAEEYPQIDWLYWVDNQKGNPSNIPGMNEIKFYNYVVFTPGGTTRVRTVPGNYWNPIIDHVIKRGMTPVFLGKSELLGGLKVTIPDTLDYHKGINLVDKTSIMESAWIMKHAACVLAYDNGLAHVASMTDANIICGYNIVHPRERRPLRPESNPGKWAEIYIKDHINDQIPRSEQELACANCQTNCKEMNLHSFKECIYSKTVFDSEGNEKEVPDTKCTDLLFDQGGKRWNDAIDKMIYPDDGIPY